MPPLIKGIATALCLITSVLAQAASDPEVDFKILTYPVSGRNLAEVQADMASFAPSKNGDAYFAGLTTWDLSTTYDLLPTAVGCLIDNGQVFLKLRVHLPQLVDPQWLSTGAIREWQRFSTSLHDHEMLHAQNAQRAAITLLSKLNGYSTDVPCDRAKVVVEQGTAALIQRISQFDNELDLHTRHGAAQGAQLAAER